MDSLETGFRSVDKFSSRDVFALTFRLFKATEKSQASIGNVDKHSLAKQLIELYYNSFETNYESMIYNFRKKYIENEARVEYNDEDNEQELIGLGLMYDYIQEYKPNEKEFNIFLEAFNLHKLLYKPLDDLRKEERERDRAELVRQLADAKARRDVVEYKRINDLLKAFGELSKSFGGNLRTEQPELKGVDIQVPTAREASDFMNGFLNPEKRTEYQNMLSNNDLFAYIDYCVRLTVDMIKYQPFSNGNKRTSRALLNLMFKNRNIPPVYVCLNERVAYKDALIKAMKTGDYTDIINFYYHKICDSIYELDVQPFIESKKHPEKQIDSDSLMIPKSVTSSDGYEIVDIPVSSTEVKTSDTLPNPNIVRTNGEGEDDKGQMVEINGEEIKLYEFKRDKRI